MDPLSNLWNRVMSVLERQSMSQVSFDTWFKDMKLKDIDEDNKIFYVLVTSDFYKT